MSVENVRFRGDTFRLPEMGIIDLEAGREHGALWSGAEEEVQRVLPCAFEPILFVERPGINSDDRGKAIEGHMCLRSALGAEVDADLLSTSCTRMPIYLRFAALQAEVFLFKDRFHEVGATGRSLTELAMAVDDIARLPVDRVFNFAAQTVPQMHLIYSFQFATSLTSNVRFVRRVCGNCVDH